MSIEPKVVNRFASHLNKLVYDKCNKQMAVQDIDMIITYYKIPGKPQLIIEEKQNNEKLTGQQWYNLPRWEKERGMPYVIIRKHTEDSYTIERVAEQYQNTKVIAFLNEQQLVDHINDYSLIKSLIDANSSPQAKRDTEGVHFSVHFWRCNDFWIPTNWSAISCLLHAVEK